MCCSGAFEVDLEKNDSGGVWLPDYQEDPSFGRMPSYGTLLALFYPSVTGIMAGMCFMTVSRCVTGCTGSNRSGLLADPGRSIPIGTSGCLR